MAGRKKIVHQDIVGAAVAARAIGITEARLRQLVNEGKLPREKTAKYNLPKVVAAFIKLKVDDALRRAQVDTQSTADKLRERREQQITQRMDKEARELIPKDDVLADRAFVTGKYLTSLSGMPARLTKNLDERRRVEAIFDQERLRLHDIFEKSRRRLLAGHGPAEADDEDDT